MVFGGLGLQGLFASCRGSCAPQTDINSKRSNPQRDGGLRPGSLGTCQVREEVELFRGRAQVRGSSGFRVEDSRVTLKPNPSTQSLGLQGFRALGFRGIRV